MKKVIKDFMEKYPTMSENDAAFHIANLNLTALTQLRDNLKNSYILINQSPFDEKKNVVNKDIHNVNEKLVKQASKKNYFNDIANLWEVTKEGTKKTQKGSDLIKHVVKLESMNYNGLRGSDMIDYQDLKKTVSNFKSIYKNGGKVVSYDYETLAGINSLGHQQNDFITEYSISVANVKGIDNIGLKKPNPKDMSKEEYKKALNEYNKKLKDIQTHNIDKLFKFDENLSHTSLLGFSDNEYKQIKTYVKSLESKPELISRDNVYLKRLSMLADPNIGFDFNKNGFDVTINKTSEDIEINVENALKGLDKYREIGKRQEEWISKNVGKTSLEDYKKEIIKKVDRLASQGIDFNGNKIGNFVTVGQNIYNYDRNVARTIAGANNELLPGTQLDTYQVFKLVEEKLGYGEHLSKGQKVSKEFGSATQDAIKKARGFFDKTGVSSHNANEDERSLVTMLFGLSEDVQDINTLGEEIISKMKKVDNLMEDMTGVQKAKNNDGVFLFTNSAKTENAGKGALSFTYHPSTKQYKTFSGFNINNKGEVVQDINKQWGPKKNALYTKEDLVIDLNQDNWNEIFNSLNVDEVSGEEFFQNYKNLDKLYVSKMQEYISPEEAKKYTKEELSNRPVHFIVSQDPSEISNATLKVGKINKNGEFLLSQKVTDKLDYFKTEVDNNGNVVSRKLKKEEVKKQIVDRAATSTMYDSIGRDIRDSQVRKILKYNEFKKANDGLSISRYLSELVSKNKELKIEDTQEIFNELVNVIGYSYKGKKGLTNESFGKALELDKVTQSFDRLFDSLSQNVKKDFGEDIFKTFNIQNPLDKNKPLKGIAKNSISQENEFKYNLIFDRMMDILHDDFKGNNTFRNLTSKATPMQGTDFNVIDFARKDVLINSKDKFFDSSRKENSKYITLNLNNRNSLLNMFFNDRYGEDKALSKQGSAGLNSLYDAFVTINNDKRFKGKNAFGYINKEYIKSYGRDENSVIDLGNKMQTELLKTLKSMQKETSNKAVGLLFERRSTDYNIDPENLSKFMHSLPQEYYDKLYKRAKDTLPMNFTGVTGSTDEMRNMLLQNYFLNFNEADIAKKIGELNADDRNYILNQIDYAKQDAASLADDLIKASKEAKANLIVSTDKNNKGIFLLKDNEIKKLNLYNYTERNGTLFTAIGNDLYNTQLGLNASEYIRENKYEVNDFNFKRDMKISTTNEKYRKTRRSLTTDVAYANRNEIDAVEQLVSSANRLTNGARAIAPRVEASNFANLYTRQFGFDMNDIIKVLPDMENELKNLEQTYNINPNNIKYIQDLISNMKDNMKVTGRVNGVEDILTVQKTAFFRSYVGPLMDLAGSLNDDRIIDFNGQKIKISSAAAKLNNNLKDSDFQKFIVMGIENPMFNPFAHIDNNARPPVMQQANFETYDASKAKQAIDDMINKTDSKAVKKSLESIKLTNNASLQKGLEMEKSLGDYKAGAVINSLQIDNEGISKVFRDDIIDAKSLNKQNKFYQTVKKAYGNNLSEEEIKSIAKQLADRTSAFSTYEQQSIMNSRVAANIFNVENKKVVKGKNRLIENHIANLEVIENTKTQSSKLIPIIDEKGNIKYQVGRKVDSKEILGLFGENEVEKTTRFKGILRGRYQDINGNNISEEEVNRFVSKYIKENNILKNKNKLSEEDRINIFRALENKWEYNYEVIRRNASGAKKLFTEASEKTTFLSMELGLGSIDKNILKDLQKIGIHETSGVLSSEYHDYLKERIKESTDSKTAQNLIDRIEKERHLLSDAISEFDIIKNNNIHQLLAVNTAKHSSASIPLSNIINNDELFNAFKEHNLFEKLFEGEVKIKDGRLITDKITGVNLKKENIEKILNVFDKETQKKFEDIIFGNNSLVDLKGNAATKENAVGHIFNSLVVQAKDDASGISTTNEEAGLLSITKDRYNEELNSIQQKLSDKNIDIETFEKLSEREKYLKESLSDIDKRLVLASKDKGLKYSERMDVNLNRVKFNQSKIDQLKEQLNNDSLFNKAFGRVVDSNGMIKEEYNGRSILESVTGQLRKQISLAHGETPLALVKDKPEYAHLVDAYKGDLNNISVERANMAYSIDKGYEAIAFNDLSGRKQGALVETLTNGNDYKSYKLVDMSNRKFDAANNYLDLDIGKQANVIKEMPNNPYNKNIILKTGLGGDEEYLAIARMPVKQFDNSLIKENHISMLNSIQRDIKDLNSGKLDSLQTEQKEKNLRATINKFKKQQIQDVTSKNGLMGKMQEARLGSTFIGKASGLTIKGLDNLDGTVNGLKNFAYENVEALSKAKFMGQSLIEHYSNNRLVDAAFMSENAFREMGYFDKKYMSNVFDNMNKDIKKEVFGNMEQTSNNYEKAMKNLLSTYGDNFIGTRFPEIQEGSDKMVMGYLDTSLKENEIRVMAHTGMSAKLDHDGDQFFMARNQLADKSESYLNYVTGINVSKDIKEIGQDTESFMLSRAVNENIYWNNKIKKQLEKEQKIAVSGNRLDEIGKRVIIDGKVRSKFNSTEHISDFDLRKMVQGYKHYEDGLIDMSIKNGSTDEAVDWLKSKYTGNELEQEINDFSNAYVGRLYLDERIAKSSRFAIGETNVTNFKLKNIISHSLDATTEDYDYKSNILTDMLYQAEEAVISSKSSVETLHQADRAKIWNDSAKNLLLGRGNSTEIKKTMKDWMKNNLSGAIDYSYHFQTSDYFKGIVKDIYGDHDDETILKMFEDSKYDDKAYELQTKMSNDLISMIESMQDNNDIKNVLESSSLGYSVTGVKKPLKNATAMEDTVASEVGKVLNNMNANQLDDLRYKFSKHTIENSDDTLYKKVFKETAESASKEEKIHGILDGVGEIFKSSKGPSKLAMGALGLAAGVMAIGFVGGRPTPADTQAMEQAQQAYTPMDGPLQLADVPQISQGSNRGYVVNINARTDKGRDHAAQAIQQAISSALPSNVNIAMNINNNYGNINNRDVEAAMMEALGY